MSQTEEEAQTFIDNYMEYMQDHPRYITKLLKASQALIKNPKSELSRADLLMIMATARAGNYRVLMDALQNYMQELHGDKHKIEFDNVAYQALFTFFLTVAVTYYMAGVDDSLDADNNQPIEKREK